MITKEHWAQGERHLQKFSPDTARAVLISVMDEAGQIHVFRAGMDGDIVLLSELPAMMAKLKLIGLEPKAPA